ncbi:molecular chaperone DnaJ [Egibacter rhizosphaerae]|uniref:Molecular chaperone DnaJ n=1 Tax=Egibacter rhizosphaerae TaxID=1670831 RepID=A0A411YDX4_9ACTN|nr:molecular chaperone DnaJ [Egibacter rhizosphaerae]QBI19386.1 molecular chaperone DnaJ [Egibacter rhizosphaerae]
MRIVCRPLTNWPGQLREPGQRRRAPFSAGWTATQELLGREARMIGGRDLVFQLALDDTQLRIDGWPRAKAQTDHPGVTVVVPDTDHGRLSWSTDRYTRWQDNVRAIGLSMEALRAADRHGVMAGRQYAGFRELGSGESDEPRFATVEMAARWLASASGWSGSDLPDSLVTSPGVRENAWREAAKRLHPDAGGNPEAFRRLEEAKRMLDLHGGGA